MILGNKHNNIYYYDSCYGISYMFDPGRWSQHTKRRGEYHADIIISHAENFNS